MNPTMSNIFRVLIAISLFPSCFLLAQTNIPQLVIINAKVHTVDSKTPNAEAIAIKANRIIAVGSTSDIKKLINVNTKVIDAKGKLVLPGFNDSHVHFNGIGNQFSSIDLRNARSPQDVIRKLRHYARFLPKGRWILGGQWNHNNWTPNDLPTKELIDSVTPNNPVFIYNHDAKMALVNSLALKLAGIDKNKRDIAGGEIVRYSNGEPTGLLKDKAIVFARIVAPKYHTKNGLEVIETGTNYAASLGVTSVQDMHSDYLLKTLNALKEAGKLKTRVYDCTPLLEWKKLAKMRVEKPKEDSMIRTGCLKFFSDGSRDAIPLLTKDIAGADKAGLQVMMHAIGSRSNDVVLTIYESVLRKNGRRDRRFRIEHAFSLRNLDLKRFAKSGTIASLQPHLFGGRDPYRTLIKKDVNIAFGSDASITDFNPLFGIHAAVNSGNPNENLSVEEAVRFYTLGSAYAEFQEKLKGSITVGKLADLIILSDDILTIPPQKIKTTEVLMTIVDGKIVYKNKKFNIK